MNSNPIMAKVRAMLDLSDSEAALGNHETAANHRATAERWMKKYRLEEEQLIASDPTSVKPVWGDTPVAVRVSPYFTEYHHLFHYIASHAGILADYEWEYREGVANLVAHTVGYEADLRYAEALFTSARMVFTDKLEPVVNRQLSEEENIYRLRSAGIERVRIADMIWGLGSRRDKTLLSRIGRVYKAECAKRGEEPALSGRGVSGEAYRTQYAEQFVDTLSARLRRAQQDSGGGIVLHGRKERVREAFYERFPSRRPKPAVEGGSGTQAVAQRCEKCAKAKSGACNEHRISYGRSSAGPNPYSAAAMRGRAAGAAAANHVNLGPGGTKGLNG